MTRNHNVKTLVFNLVLALFVTILLLLICEGVVRMFFKDQLYLMPRYHTAAQYDDVVLRKIRPNLKFRHTTPDGSWEFETNSQGFRNRTDFNYEKRPGLVRVVALGDSHTQGYECHQDYTYSAVIQKYLHTRDVDIEVINTGVSGFSTAEQLLLLEKEMVKYSPDFVVLGFYANDYEDNLKAGFFSLDVDGELTQVKNEHIPGVKIQDVIYSVPGIKWLGENSYFYSMLFNTVWELYKARLAATAREEIPTELMIPGKDSFSQYEVQLTSKILARIHLVSQSIGADFVMLDIPQPAGHDDFIPSVNSELKQSLEGKYDHFVTSQSLREYSRVAQIHVPNGGRHITEFAHTLLGVEVAQFIEKRLEAKQRQRQSK